MNELEAAGFDWSGVDVVAVGASAGGVDALREVLGALPAGFRPAVLVVLHVPPDGSGNLVPLLGSACALPVAEALDKQPISGGSVAFAPSNYHLLVESGHTLALSVDPPVLYSRPAIDPLFESAAVVYGRRLLAIVLTGASSDGAEGLLAVRHRGGWAWVQDPATAVAPMMPAKALERAGADEVLTLDEICRRLASERTT
jgi:two-component system chemotaxis response regulator CheB